MSTKIPRPIIDDIFTRYERLETKYAVKVSEENVGHLARLFKWTVDYSDEEPVLVKPNDLHGYGGRRFKVGDHIDNQGSPSSVLGWRPAGTWQEVTQ